VPMVDVALQGNRHDRVDLQSSLQPAEIFRSPHPSSLNAKRVGSPIIWDKL